jgi:hypothetical protein
MNDLQDKTPTEVFEELDTPQEGDKGPHTYGSNGRAMVKIQQMSLDNLESAQKIANLYVEGAIIECMKYTNEDGSPIDYTKANSIVKQNIGYICGYYGPEMAQFWYPTIKTTHPIFGDNMIPKGVQIDIF